MSASTNARYSVPIVNCNVAAGSSKKDGSCQVEQQYFCVFRAFDVQLRLVADGCAVALCQRLSVQFHCAAGDLKPAVTSGGELVRDFFAGLEQRDVELASWLILTD